LFGLAITFLVSFVSVWFCWFFYLGEPSYFLDTVFTGFFGILGLFWTIPLSTVQLIAPIGAIGAIGMGPMLLGELATS